MEEETYLIQGEGKSLMAVVSRNGTPKIKLVSRNSRGYMETSHFTKGLRVRSEGMDPDKGSFKSGPGDHPHLPETDEIYETLGSQLRAQIPFNIRNQCLGTWLE